MKMGEPLVFCTGRILWKASTQFRSEWSTRVSLQWRRSARATCSLRRKQRCPVNANLYMSLLRARVRQSLQPHLVGVAVAAATRADQRDLQCRRLRLAVRQLVDSEVRCGYENLSTS